MQVVCAALERNLRIVFAGQAGFGDAVRASLNEARDWVTEAYAGRFAVDDLSPNIGVWWCGPYTPRHRAFQERQPQA